MITEIWSQDNKSGPELLCRTMTHYPFQVRQSIMLGKDDWRVTDIRMIITGDYSMLQEVFVTTKAIE